MRLEVALITLAVWFFLTKKVPGWPGFGWLDRLPGPFGWVWQGWKACAYCGGFWIALAVRAVTHLQTLPALSGLPWPVDWVLDAFATAILALFGYLVIETMAGPIREKEAARQNKQG